MVRVNIRIGSSRSSLQGRKLTSVAATLQQKKKAPRQEFVELILSATNSVAALVRARRFQRQRASCQPSSVFTMEIVPL